MRQPIGVVLLVLLTASVCTAQISSTLPVLSAGAARPAPGSGVILGQVVEAGTKRPIANALVTVQGPGVIERRVTDSKGRFLVKRLPVGSFSLTATRAGFFTGSFGQRRPNGSSSQIALNEGQWVGDAIIPLWRPAVVSGLVTDESNEPLVGITVRAHRRAFAGARRELIQAGEDVTDDRGLYRIANLMPGDHFVSVPATQVTLPMDAFEEVGRTGSTRGLTRLGTINRGSLDGGNFTTGVFPGVLADPDGRHWLLVGSGATPPVSPDEKTFAYPTLFYPGVPTPVGSLAVTLVAGQERHAVDFQLRPVTTARVSGRIEAPNGEILGTSLDLVFAGLDASGESAGKLAASTVVAADGTFTFLNVPAGDYVLEAHRDRRQLPTWTPETLAFELPVANTVQWARVPILVMDRPLEDVVVALQPGLEIAGRLVFDGTTPKPSAEMLSQIQVAVQAAGAEGPGAPPARVTESGEFSSPGLVPGHYLVRVGGAPAGWALRTILANGFDVADEPLDATYGGDVSNVIVTFTDKVTQVSGFARTAIGVGDPNSAVMLFPADRRFLSATVASPRRFRSTRSSATGAFTFSNLAPGDYYLAAIDEAQNGDWPDPEFIAKLQRVATRLTIREGGKKVQDVRVSIIR